MLTADFFFDLNAVELCTFCVNLKVHKDLMFQFETQTGPKMLENVTRRGGARMRSPSLGATHSSSSATA
jgi:hypothetical protein